MKKIIFATLIFSLLLCGCSIRKHHPNYRVVTQIAVTTEEDQLIYNHPEKMRTILAYIRLLYPFHDARELPKDPTRNAYEIVMTCSDGSIRRYLQTQDGYFQINDGSWKSLNHKYALILPALLKILSTDV